VRPGHKILHVYAELVAAGGSAEQHYPGIAAHLQASSACGEDVDGLLAALRDETRWPPHVIAVRIAGP
jgi:hypothetical protein